MKRAEDFIYKGTKNDPPIGNPSDKNEHTESRSSTALSGAKHHTRTTSVLGFALNKVINENAMSPRQEEVGKI